MDQINVVAGRRGGEGRVVRVAEAAFNEGGGPIKKRHEKKSKAKFELCSAKHRGKSNIFITLRFADDRTEFFPRPSSSPSNAPTPLPSAQPSRNYFVLMPSPSSTPSTAPLRLIKIQILLLHNS